RQPHSAKTHLDMAYRIASPYGDDAVLGGVLNHLGTFYAFSNDYLQAQIHLLSAEDHLRHTTNVRELGYVLGNLSLTYGKLGEYALARQASLDAVQLAETNADPSLEAMAYSNLSAQSLLLGDYDKAEHFARLGYQVDKASGREWREYI